MRYWLITLLTPLGLAGLDQAIKAWATAYLKPVGSMPLIPGVVELRYLLNTGAAFGSLAGRQLFLIIFTVVAMAAVLVYLLWKKPQSKLEYIGWLLILGGGLGNLIDRVSAQAVVDYINPLFMDFAIFNFADICISVGIGLYILDILLTLRKKEKNGAA